MTRLQLRNQILAAVDAGAALPEHVVTALGEAVFGVRSAIAWYRESNHPLWFLRDKIDEQLARFPDAEQPPG